MEVRDPARLRRARKQKRLTQRELAFLVKRSHTTIYKLESGALKTITEDLAISIAARLDQHWEDLFIDHEEVVAPQVSNVRQDERQTA
ncbi:helix-turn-helix domain-containing protein [Gordonia sp. PP30]|uniref:helix-turn-helix transcriptional regulator n=1 Tax=Gordonia sp. PP30 TaxID=2935861 RepID=UPI001FFE50F8|nr:helix-turn-helix transcriptional regulator [Gordonia sp. PP30]UQE73874.1 helix-turn-helix domain-containing protein [Gordonia sp. PP30]